MVIELGQGIKPTNIATKFYVSIEKILKINKGHNSKVLHEIWLDIECGVEIMPTNIITKFDIPSLMMIHWKKSEKRPVF